MAEGTLMMIRKKIKAFIGFRIIHTHNNFSLKPGLYLDFPGDKIHKNYRIHDKDIIDVRDWLSRYINKYVKQENTDQIIEARAKTNAILRHLNKIEAELTPKET